jgi:hypothetical protein
MLDEPSGDENTDAPVNHHRVDPVAGKFEPTNNRLFVADPTLIQTYQGKFGDFQRARIAGMTQPGRYEFVLDSSGRGRSKRIGSGSSS